MESQALLQSLRESIVSQASVKAIYGEPISAQGKTIIPVAKIMDSGVAPELVGWAIAVPEEKAAVEAESERSRWG